MAQNDTHVALIILTTQMWGGGNYWWKKLLRGKFCVPVPLAPTSVLTQNKGPDTEPNFSNPPPSFGGRPCHPPPPPRRAIFRLPRGKIIREPSPKPATPFSTQPKESSAEGLWPGGGGVRPLVDVRWNPQTRTPSRRTQLGAHRQQKIQIIQRHIHLKCVAVIGKTREPSPAVGAD